MVPRANPVMLDTATSPHARNPTLRSPFTRVIPYAVRKERSNESRQNIEWRRDVIILGPRSAKSGLQTARRTRVAARDQSRRFSNPCPPAWRAVEDLEPTRRGLHPSVHGDRRGGARAQCGRRAHRRRGRRAPKGWTKQLRRPHDQARRRAGDPIAFDLLRLKGDDLRLRPI